MTDYKKLLWSDDVKIENLIQMDGSASDGYIFNLWEDILCLKEDLAELKEDKALTEYILKGMIDKSEGNVVSASTMKERLKTRKEKLIKGEK